MEEKSEEEIIRERKKKFVNFFKKIAEGEDEEIKEEVGEVRKEVKEVRKEVEEAREEIKEGVKEIKEEVKEAREEIKEVRIERERGEEFMIEERKKKLFSLLKKTNLWVIVFLIVAVILGIYIRSLPMQDHTQAIVSFPRFLFMPWTAFGGTPGLWDITTNTWTLGPDLDPWLFLRYAKTAIEQGSFPQMDMMRNVPLGFDSSIELQMVSYMIIITYKIANVFGDHNINFAGALMPVWAFALTIVAFFLFVREIFARKDSEDKNIKANIIALISTFFMIVTPTFLSRTVAGIPEKESVAFLFMFLSFYLFLKAWKSKKPRNSVIFAMLAGAATGLMGLTWGGVSYIFVTIAAASLVAFILDRVYKKESIVYIVWFIFSILVMQVFSNRFILRSQLTSLDSGLAFFLCFVMAVHLIIWNIKAIKPLLNKTRRLPKNIVSLIIAVILGIIIVTILLGPGFIIEKISVLNRMLFKPIVGRWNITVAENRQPFFVEWAGSFGPFIKNIPVLFWMLFIGSIVLFKSILKTIKKKDSWILTGLYVFFFFGLVFSRYSGTSLFNGENFISKAFYYISALLLIGGLVYYYIEYYKEEQMGFEKIDYEYLFLFALFALCLFTARSAVRLIMVLAPIAPIFLSYLVVGSIIKFRKTKDDFGKIILGIIVILILLLSLFIFWNYYREIKGQAYNFIPSYYNQQWQKAMLWVRENTAEDAVFSHWWDYGYWLQSIGNRATVLDGGNAITYWNYLMGRLVLTGDNQEDALEFLYNHDSTHLLIDSTDIGKYTAFSSIGSDENYDRYGWIPAMVSDERQTQETKNGTKRLYQGGSAIDEDISYKKGDEEIFLPGQRAGIGGVIIEVEQGDGKITFKQPEAIFVYQGQQHNLPLRYIYYNGEFFDFKSGIEGCAYILQRVYPANQGLKLDNTGALMYLSPRLMRGLLAQIYILDDPFNNFPNFKIVHTEPNLIIESLNSQGMDLNEFVYYQGIQGPIKIWEIEYTGNEEIKEEYLDKDPSKYISWQL